MHLEILAFYFSSENYIPFENLEGHSSSTCVFHLNAYFDILGIENATKFLSTVSLNYTKYLQMDWQVNLHIDIKVFIELLFIV